MSSPTAVATFLGVFALSAGGHAAAGEIVLRADPYCPYNCEPESDAPGFMIEIAREALAMYGHTVVYETAPWVRTLQMARTGAIAGAVGAIPEEAPDLLYGVPLGAYSDAVAIRSGETITPSDPASYEGWRVGVIDGYDYFGPIADYIEANVDDRTIVQHATGERPLDNNLRKLRAGRIDMVTDAQAVLAYALASQGLGDELEIVVASEPDPIYIGFSPVLPEAALYNDQLAKGVAALRETGRLAEILARYGASDWAE